MSTYALYVSQLNFHDTSRLARH